MTMPSSHLRPDRVVVVGGDRDCREDAEHRHEGERKMPAMPQGDIGFTGGALTTCSGSALAVTTTVPAIMSCSDWRFCVKATMT